MGGPGKFPLNSAIVDGPTIEEAGPELEWHGGDLVGSSPLSVLPKRLFLGSTAANMLRVLGADAGGARDQLSAANLL